VRRIAARVGVEGHESSGAPQKAFLENLARLNRGAVKRYGATPSMEPYPGRTVPILTLTKEPIELRHLLVR
jgi:hypothetical protein